MDQNDQNLVEFIKELKALIKKYAEKFPKDFPARKEMAKLLLFYANILWPEGK